MYSILPSVYIHIIHIMIVWPFSVHNSSSEGQRCDVHVANIFHCRRVEQSLNVLETYLNNVLMGVQQSLLKVSGTLEILI